MPPALAWRLERKKREADEIARMSALYGQFARTGETCFDIGANLGNRVRCFRAMGCPVVAVEPQPFCLKRLAAEFGGNSGVIVIPAAAAASEGRLTLRTSRDHVLSTFSDVFIERTRASGRFASSTWDQEVEVPTVTLDQLIERHGEPVFVKIDVEGFESEVLAGLSRPVRAVSFELVPELPENAQQCVRHLASLGSYEFAASWGESMVLSPRGWRSPASMLAMIDELAGESIVFGDIYARLKS